MQAKEIVTELYSLRAGLSLIAKEKDAYDNEIRIAEGKKNNATMRARALTEPVIQAENAKIDAARKASDDESRRLSYAKYQADECMRRYESNENILDDFQYTAKKRKYLRAATLRFLWLICPIVYVAAVVLSHVFYSVPFVTIPLLVVLCIELILFNILSKGYELDFYTIIHILDVLVFIGHIIMYYCGVQAWHGAYFYVCAPPMLITGGSIICVLMRMWEDGFKFNNTIEDYECHIEEKKECRKKQSELKKAAEEAERQYEEMKKASYNSGGFIDIRECERIKRAAENELSIQLNSAFEQYQEACSMARRLHGNICSGIWDTLVSTYGALLDCRDWGILDLVIWQLETGRAETIKEALQLADRETQTDRIVKTMQSASAAIAQRIDDGFGSLKTQLSNSFYTLAVGLANATSTISGQISRSSEMLSGKIGESAQITASLYQSQKDNMQTANKRLEQLFSQASLQTALLEKSNSSSKELVAAVNNMRKAQA